MTHATFRIHETADGGFRWRLQTDDGSVIATSDGTHDTRHAAMRDVQQVKCTATDADVEPADADSS